MDVRQIGIAFRLLAREEQIHELVVSQFHQPRKSVNLFIRQTGLMSIQETSHDQIVLQQTTSRTPAKSRTLYRISLMRYGHIPPHLLYFIRPPTIAALKDG
jgi:hypothetical protein